MIRLCVLVLSLVIVQIAVPNAQDFYVGQARVQLAAIARSAVGAGWELTHNVVTGALPENGSDIVRVRLLAGRSYAITATCDQDCSDIDLELIDPAGTVVRRDVRPDDTPVVTARPRLDGNYRVRAIMASCTREPCRYAVGVFGQ